MIAELDIIGLEVSKNNNLVLKFNKNAYVIGHLTQDDYEIRISRHDGTRVKNSQSSSI
jgi:hypothetical protein